MPSKSLIEKFNELLKKYKIITDRVDKLEKELTKLKEQQRKLRNTIEKIQAALKKKEEIAPSKTMFKKGYIYMYFYVPKSQRKIIEEKGFKPIPFPGIEGERKIFFDILKERKISFPKKVVIGRLTPKPPFSPRFVYKKVLFKAKIPVEHIWIGYYEFYAEYISATIISERIKWLKNLAESIEYLPRIGYIPQEKLNDLIAFTDLEIPPENLSITMEHLKYFKIAEIDKILRMWS